MSIPTLSCSVSINGICLRKPPVEKQKRRVVRLTEKSIDKPLSNSKANDRIVQEKQRTSDSDDGFWWDNYDLHCSCETPTSPIITAGIAAYWGENRRDNQ